MKKKVILVTVIAVIVIASGAYMLFNSVFPLANPSDCPNEQDVISFSVLYDNEPFEISGISPGSILTYIKTAEPTRNVSLNDIPDTSPYFEIIASTDAQQYKYFIYEESNTLYLEMPYYGIYILDEDILALLQ